MRVTRTGSEERLFRFRIDQSAPPRAHESRTEITFVSHQRAFNFHHLSLRLASLLFLCASATLSGCSHPKNSTSGNRPAEINVAAASNLTDALSEINKQFTAQTGIRVVTSFGATADLSKQVENGAPFDVFAAADREHVDALSREGLLLPDTQKLYVRGRLVLWIPAGSTLKLTRLEDLSHTGIERLAIAKPDVAPYGRASIEALKALNLWPALEPKIIYGQNVSQTKQYAATGNTDAAMIPLALVHSGEGQTIEVDQKLHSPIEQSIAVIKSSRNQDAARRYVNFILSPEGQAILERFGYERGSK